MTLVLLPDEIWVEILTRVLPDIGLCTHETENAFLFRQVSSWLRNIVDTQIFARVTSFSGLMRMPYLSIGHLSLFRGVMYMDLGYHCCVNDDNITQLSWLSGISMPLGGTNISGVSLRKLTNLKSLHLRRSTTSQIAGLTCLTQLEELKVEGHSTLSDKDLIPLQSLKSLHLSRESPVTGYCFGMLPNLEALTLSGQSDMQISELYHLANQLKTLRLISCGMKPGSFEELANLTTLQLTNSYLFSNTMIQKLTSLTALTVENTSIVDQEGLVGLTRLRSLKISRVTPITIRMIQCLAPSLTSIDLSCCRIALDELLCFTALKTLKYGPLTTDAHNLLRERGVVVEL